VNTEVEEFFNLERRQGQI